MPIKRYHLKLRFFFFFFSPIDVLFLKGIVFLSFFLPYYYCCCGYFFVNLFSSFACQILAFKLLLTMLFYCTAIVSLTNKMM